MQALERQSRWVLEAESHSSLEAYGRYHIARQWHREQVRLRDPGIAQLVGQVHLECEGRARIIRDEQVHCVAVGACQVWEAEEMGREYTWRLSLLPALARGKCLIVAHVDMHVKLMTEAQQQGVNAIIVRCIRLLLQMDTQMAHPDEYGVPCTQPVLDPDSPRRMQNPDIGEDSTYVVPYDTLGTIPAQHAHRTVKHQMHSTWDAPPPPPPVWDPK